MTAKMRNSSGFTKLEMYAKSNGRTSTLDVKGENPGWKIVEIDNVRVGNGKVELGFNADGLPNAFCLVDDVTFVKIK